MKLHFGLRYSILLVVLCSLVAVLDCSSTNAAVGIPSPIVDAPLAKAKSQQTAVIAGGCFWGIQAVFQHVKGVTKVTSGYSGGAANTAEYELVSSGTTGHAESVRITYDASQVSYGQILRVFFSVHDPTQFNRQGPDTGSQYRSAIFYSGEEQKHIAEAYITQLEKVRAFPSAIVTQVVPLNAFYSAENYHQDYAVHHPHDPYIVINDLPKIAHLRRYFPDLYIDKEQ